MAKSKSEILDDIERKAKEAQSIDDVCGRSTIYGLSQHFTFIPEELVTAALSLSGGCGSSSGSCGAYVCGLLAIGTKFNPPMGDHSKQVLIKRDIAARKRNAFRDAFIKEFGTTMCPGVQEKLFGRSFNLMDDRQREEFFSLPEHEERCAAVVAKSARMAAEIILEEAEASS